MLNVLIDDLLEEKGTTVDIFHDYIKEAYQIKDINRWAVKKSITTKVLNPERTNEMVVLAAVKHRNPREGDKFFLYSALDGMRQKIVKGELVFLKNGTPSMIPNNILKCADEWTDDHNKEHYVKRVYMTISILKNLFDIDDFVKYHNKGNIKLLEELVDA
jgi:hypothetical protein